MTRSSTSTRSSMAQLKHDVMIDRLAEQLASKYQTHDILKNPGHEHNAAVDGCWPDLLLRDRAGRIRAVFEVETVDTVAREHATAQWSRYAQLGVPFYLVIPSACERAARALLRELHVHIEKLVLY